jgi:DNA-directed RNA polymerase specialized sigma24 family protein
MTAPDLEVKYGYTLRDLQQMTAAALLADRSMAMDYTERRDIAWSAIAEALCEAPHWPKRSELIQAGWQAIYRAVREEYRQHGYADRAWGAGHASAPRFVKFWYSGPTPSHEDRIVEKLATHQIVDTLTPACRDAIVALAVHDNYRLAAESLGINDKAFRARLITARRRLLAHWFEGETPRKTRGTDRRVGVHGRELSTTCSKGHERTPENTFVRYRILHGKRHRSRVCRACDRDRRGGQEAAA